MTRAPAPDAAQREAESICATLMDALGYVGVLAVELFEVGARLLANEFAPRVHNTGHWTIDGAETSQFENHLRALLGLPLGSTGPRAQFYGKAPRPGRKVGHVTFVGPADGTVERAAELADAAASVG